ncbi:retrotransposon protein, putative, ty1-copia subclass [Tanacetum coccineum]
MTLVVVLTFVLQNRARKLKQGALYLYVGNGVRAQVEAIGSYDLVFPNGLCFIDFGISVSKNNVFYFNVIPSNGIYEIDMHDLVPNINSIYNVSTKRVKHNLDSTYLWHCRLAHISMMTRKSFPHHPERVADLLGIIHTGVCGPLRHVSRQGASYFITFTDDYSRYDRGGEYISQEFKDYLKEYGIVQQLTPPYTPQHNRVSERRNHTLLDMVRSMMNLTTLPLSFWDYDLESATRILNMVPTKKGCEALVKRDTPDKLQQRSVKCIFIGYPKETMGYYFYFPPKNKIVVTRYAEFFEKSLITQEVSGRAMDLEEIQDEDTSPSEITSKIPMEVKGFEPPQEEVILIDAMNEEIQSMIDNMVWVLVDLPPGSKGYTQLYGFDYEEMFSPVADIKAIRILISIAAFYDYEILQMDVKTAFLNGYLDEDIYMVQPEGFVDHNHPRKALGSIMYAVRCTRPDVAFAQNITSRFQQNPGEHHWTAMKNILKYLRNTKDMFLVYGGNLEAELLVDCYCDAGIETDRDNTKSQTGYVFILNGGVVDWKSSKQSTTAMYAT